MWTIELQGSMKLIKLSALDCVSDHWQVMYGHAIFKGLSLEVDFCALGQQQGQMLASEEVQRCFLLQKLKIYWKVI